MDPNYHYIICHGDKLYLRDDTPLVEMGLNSDFDTDEALWNAFYNSENDYNEEKCEKALINYLLTLDEDKKKYIFIKEPYEFRIVRVPNELANYTVVKHRKVYYKGGIGYIIEEHVIIKRNKAIADVTKKTLEDPTPENLEHLKEKIAFIESYRFEEVETDFAEEDYDNGEEYHSSDYYESSPEDE